MMRFSARHALLVVLSACVAGPLEAEQRPVSSGLASRIDHVMYTGGPELAQLVEILRDRLLLPVMFDGPKQTPPTPGICFTFGNTCLEIVPLRADGNGPPPPAGLGSVALEARAFGTVVESLTTRGIEHFPPAEQAQWTTIGLRGFGGGMFFIEYRAGMTERRILFRQALDDRQGGRLGIVRLAELSRAVDSKLDDVQRQWARLFGEPSPGDSRLWAVGDGPALRLVARSDSRAGRIVVEVRSLRAAAAALRDTGLPFLQTQREIAIEPKALLGLRLLLVEPGTTPSGTVAVPTLNSVWLDRVAPPPIEFEVRPCGIRPGSGPTNRCVARRG